MYWMRYKIDWNGTDRMQIQSRGSAQKLFKKDEIELRFVI
jgi:hypothetical protein